MKYEYRKAPNQTEFSVYQGLGVTALDMATLEKDVPCQAACPAKTDVPAYIQALAEGDPDKAYRINLEDNVFPSVLGRVCTRPCEAACRHTWTNIQGPVAICHLKRAGADYSEQANGGLLSPLPSWFEKSTKRVAVIGGGPAGLTAARELIRYGHSVSLFERRDHLGGMMLDGIPRFRLPKDSVEREIDLIVDSGIDVRLNQNIDKARLAAIIAEYDAVLVAVGTTLAKNLEFPAITATGAAKSEGAAVAVHDGLEFMRQYNEGEITSLSGDVVVIGGGFTAVDCARSCARAARRLLGSRNKVTIAYRRTEALMSADFEEREEIRNENIDILTLAGPVGLRHQDGELEAVVFQRNMLSDELGKDGKPKIAPVPNSEYEVRARHLIIAIGQDSDYSLLPEGIVLDYREGASGNLNADENPAQRSSNPKVFAAGDFLTGSSDVIHAVAEGKAAADEIDRFLTGQKRVKHHVAIEEIINETQTGRTRDHDLRFPTPMAHLPVNAREAATSEVVQGFDQAAVDVHASRCYLCNHKFEIDQDKCIHCDWCIDVAPRNCIKKVSRVFRDAEGIPTGFTEAATAREATFIYIDSDECIRCGKCLRVCPTNAISMKKMERTPCAAHSAVSGLKAVRGLQAETAMAGKGAGAASGGTTQWVQIQVKR